MSQISLRTSVKPLSSLFASSSNIVAFLYISKWKFITPTTLLGEKREQKLGTRKKCSGSWGVRKSCHWRADTLDSSFKLLDIRHHVLRQKREEGGRVELGCKEERTTSWCTVLVTCNPVTCCSRLARGFLCTPKSAPTYTVWTKNNIIQTYSSTKCTFSPLSIPLGNGS